MDFDIKPKASVLVVSSSRGEFERLHNLFGGSQWTARHAENCRSGVAILRNEAQPIALCDDVLEDGDWRRFVRETQNLKRPPTIIVTSTKNSAALWAEVLNLGAYDVLEKPFRAQELFWTLSSAWMHTTHEWRKV